MTKSPFNGGDPSQTHINGTGRQDAPTDRPPVDASKSIGRQQKYGETGRKS
jgi:hypothetical protein